jgi:hypothetical protein
MHRQYDKRFSLLANPAMRFTPSSWRSAEAIISFFFVFVSIFIGACQDA